MGYHLLLLYYGLLFSLSTLHSGVAGLVFFKYRLPVLKDYLIFSIIFSLIIFNTCLGAYFQMNRSIFLFTFEKVSIIQEISYCLFIFIIPFLLHSLLEVELKNKKNLFFMALSLLAMISSYSHHVLQLKSYIFILTIFCFMASLVYSLSLIRTPIKPHIPALQKKALLTLFWGSLCCSPLLIFDILKPAYLPYYPWLQDILLFSLYYFIWSLLFLWHSSKFLITKAPSTVPALTLSSFISRYHLTEREADLLPFIMEGYSNKEIAKKLFIAEITVKKHLQKIFEKTHAKNKVELMALFLPLHN